MLQIARVQKEDAGRYTCQAVNEAGEDHMHFELHILGMYMVYRSHCRCDFFLERVICEIQLVFTGN